LTLPDYLYVVLDVPSPFDERIAEIRARHRDIFRMSLPAEITVAGSGGIGFLAPDQEPADVSVTLNRIAASTSPIRARFGPVQRFPGSDTFYLSLVDETPFRKLQQRIARSGLRFQPTPFEFVPHCTLRTRTPVSPDEAADLLQVRIDGEFLLDTMTVYELPLREPPSRPSVLLCLWHRVRLRGADADHDSPQ
jgi:2'-5' RNA ligase